MLHTHVPELIGSPGAPEAPADAVATDKATAIEGQGV